MRSLLTGCAGLDSTLGRHQVPRIGRVCEKLLKEVLNASTCGELLGSSAEAYCLFSRVRSDALLKVALGWCDAERGESGAPQKGISFSDTFASSDHPDVLRRQLRLMCEGLASAMCGSGLRGSKLTLRLKDSSFGMEPASNARPGCAKRARPWRLAGWRHA